MTKLWCGLCVMAVILAVPAVAMQCTLTGVPLQVSAEGLAEPVGDMLLQCSGGPANGVLSGSFQIFLNKTVANRLDANKNYVGITLGQELPGMAFTTQPATIRPLEGSILVENFQIVMNSQGFFSIKFSGIRADAGGNTRAYLQFSGNQQLQVSAPVVTVAVANPTLLATQTGAAASGLGPTLPAEPDFSTMIAARVPMATTRVTEGWGNAFVPRDATNFNEVVNGTRIMIRLSGVPAGVRVFAPDAVAGSSAAQPTFTGDLGNYPISGYYIGGGGHSLLMSRVRYTEPDGSGGFPGFYPGNVGISLLTGVREADVAQGVPYLVYEAIDADPGKLESAEIPIWVILPSDRYVTPSVVRQTLTLAPLSDKTGSVEGAPIPRYRAADVASDCAVLGDCAAPYFPKMTVTPPESTEFTAAAGAGHISAYFLLNNTGGGLLEWRVSARYLGTTTGWITVSPDSGFDNRTIRFDLLPAGLTPGRYEGEVVVQQVGAATGTNAQVVIPVKFNVTQATTHPVDPPVDPPIDPPAVPLPTITSIVDPANRWTMTEAPGALVILMGVNFADSTSVKVGGKAARIVTFSPTELLVELPLDLPTGRAEVLPSNNGANGPATAIDIAPVAPSTLAVLNSDSVTNSEQFPAEAGKTIQLLMTGIRGATHPLSMKVHDRYLYAEVEATDQPGLDRVTFIVPDDFPTMSTSVYACAVPIAVGDVVCSHPKDFWVKVASRPNTDPAANY